MPLVTSSKPLYGRDIPEHKYSQLTSVFNQREVYNLTATYIQREWRLSIFAALFIEDIRLFFILYLKLYIMVWQMAGASFE